MIHRCKSCQRTCVGTPKSCQWCGASDFEVLGPSTAPFDPFAYAKDVRENPEKYGSIKKLSLGLLAKRGRPKAAVQASRQQKAESVEPVLAKSHTA